MHATSVAGAGVGAIRGIRVGAISERPGTAPKTDIVALASGVARGRGNDFAPPRAVIAIATLTVAPAVSPPQEAGHDVGPARARLAQVGVRLSAVLHVGAASDHAVQALTGLSRWGGTRNSTAGAGEVDGAIAPGGCGGGDLGFDEVRECLLVVGGDGEAGGGEEEEEGGEESEKVMVIHFKRDGW